MARTALEHSLISHRTGDDANVKTPQTHTAQTLWKAEGQQTTKAHTPVKHSGCTACVLTAALAPASVQALTSST